MQHAAPDAAAATAASAVTLAGLATGLHYEVLLAGFAGALVSLSYTASRGIWSRLWSLITASLTAGYVAPAAASYLTHLLPGAAEMQGGLVFAGFGVGLSAQVLIPGAMDWVRRKLEAPA